MTEDWFFLFANERFFIIVNRTAWDLPARIMHFAHYAFHEELKPKEIERYIVFQPTQTHKLTLAEDGLSDMAVCPCNIHSQCHPNQRTLILLGAKLGQL